MYMHPKTKLMKAEANDKKAAVLIMGVLAESIWKIVRTALNERIRLRATGENNSGRTAHEKRCVTGRVHPVNNAMSLPS